MLDGAKRFGVPAIVFALAACVGGPAAPSAASNAAGAGRTAARLIFDDEFDGGKLDASKWFWCYPSGGPHDCTNNQYGIPYREREQYRPSQLVVGRRRAASRRRAAFRQAALPLDVGHGDDGRSVHERAAATVFRLQVRLRRDAREAALRPRLLAAFWLLPASGAWPPEIDVMEWQGAQPRRDYMTVHFSDAHSSNDPLQATFDGPNFSRAFHVFAIEWTSDALTWFVDGAPRFDVSAKQIESRGGRFLRTPMYVLVNLAVGGWVSPPNRRTPSPAAMIVDYVRVYDRRP